MAQPVHHAHAPHVVVLTSPGAGHVVPVAELASRLAAHHSVAATVVTFANLSSPEHSSPLASLPPGVRTIELPVVPLDDLPHDAHLVTRIITVVHRTLPHLRDLLRSLTTDSSVGVTAFLTDMLCPTALAVAEDLGVPRFVFYTSSLMSLASLLHAPELARTTTCECRDLPEPVRLPGCVPLHGADLVDPLQDRANPVYELIVGMGLDYLRADGFVVNTFDAMEHETLVAFQELSREQDGVYPPAHAVGPFVRSCNDKAARHECVRWLDEKPDGSVLYVCFGSGGTLSTQQNADLAAGLEASGHRFLWVVRHPSDKDCSASYFGAADHGGEPVVVGVGGRRRRGAACETKGGGRGGAARGSGDSREGTHGGGEGRCRAEEGDRAARGKKASAPGGPAHRALAGRGGGR